MACAKCGGAKRMKAGGTSTEDPVSKKTIRQGMRAERKMDRQDKRWDRKYEKQKAEELMKSKRFKNGGMTGIIGMPKYGNNPNTQEGRMLKKGGSAASKKCPPGHYWTADLGCQPKYAGYKGPLSSIGAKLGVGAGLAGGVAMAAKAISDRKKRKAAEKEESMKLVNDARKIKDKLAPKKYGGLAKADSGMQVKPNITRPLPPNTSGVRKKYANGGVTQSFAQNRAVMASCKNGMVRDANGRCVMERKMAVGGVAKKPLRKAQYGTAGSTTPAPAPAPAVKKPAFAAPTPEENKYLVSVYNQRNKTTLPDNTPMSPSSENFRTRSGGFNVYPTPKQKTTAPIPAGKRGGTKMQVGGATARTRKTISGGTKTRMVNGDNINITRRDKAGNITKQKTRKAVKGWDEDDYKVGGSTKAKKFAALAPPYNKATAADRIAGAKKNAKKK